MPQRFQVRISREASANLDAIFAYIQAESPSNAARVVERLLNAIENLDLFPHRYKICRQHKKLEMVVRSMPVPPFMVYYRILEPSRIVRILTVRHGAQRQPKSFGK